MLNDKVCKYNLYLVLEVDLIRALKICNVCFWADVTL